MVHKGKTINMNIVAYTPVATQRPQTNMFPPQRLNYRNEERCFLRGPYKGPGSDSVDILVLKVWCSKRCAYVEGPAPASLKRRPHFETFTCLGDN
jgi:hypothetical protein